MLKWVQLKVSPVLGRGLNEKDYAEEGVMEATAEEDWRRYWKDKAANKASDAQGKHSNLFKALIKGVPFDVKGAPAHTEHVMDDIRRYMNVIIETVVIPDAWKDEVLCTL